MRTPLVAVRHAPPRTPGVCYGRADVEVEVVADGVLQGWELAAVDVVWTSPSPRCAELARRLARHLEVPHREDPRLFELDFGAWEGVPWDAIPAEPLEAWMTAWQTARPPGGETLPELHARVAGWHDDLDPDRRHLLVAHAGVVRALWVVRHGLDWDTAMGRPVPHLEPLDLDELPEGDPNP